MSQSAGKVVTPLRGGSLRREVAGVLGISDTHSVDLDFLQRVTRARLLQASRLLALRGVSKLRVGELAARVNDALAEETFPPLERTLEKTSAAAETERGVSAPSREQTIPWSYGRERVRAMPVDPERLFAYWELTDDAVARARVGLGPAGESAWLNLRVYDTTGRLFDGANAHSYLDQRVERTDRQWFFTVGRPGSEAFVEIGMKSVEGHFIKVARSGRVSFPRRDPVEGTTPEWITVRSETMFAHNTHAPPPEPQHDRGPEEIQGGFEVEETTVVHECERISEDRVYVESWEAGPFSYPVGTVRPVREFYEGGVQTFTVQGRTHVVYGPWSVIIRGVGAYRGGAVLAHWRVYRSWRLETSGETPEPRVVSGFLEGAEPTGASELRLQGSSELSFLGASELRYGGASEREYMGASERRWLGASERIYQGASEARLGRSGRR